MGTSDVVKVIPFIPEHLLTMDVRPSDAWTYGIDRLHTATFYYRHGPSYTMVDELGPVAVGGIVVLHRGVGEGWMLCNERVTVHARTLVDQTQGLLLALSGALHLHRLQSTVHSADDRAQRFLLRMGFVYEGTLKLFGPDKADFHMFVRLTHG